MNGSGEAVEAAILARIEGGNWYPSEYEGKPRAASAWNHRISKAAAEAVAPIVADPQCPADLSGARCSLFVGHEDNHATSFGKRGAAALGRRYDGDWFEWADDFVDPLADDPPPTNPFHFSGRACDHPGATGPHRHRPEWLMTWTTLPWCAGPLPKSMLINPSDFDFEDNGPVTLIGAPTAVTVALFVALGLRLSGGAVGLLEVVAWSVGITVVEIVAVRMVRDLAAGGSLVGAFRRGGSE